MQNPFSWKSHSLALGGPVALWVAFLYSRGAVLDVFGGNLNVMLLGVFPGMSLGYLLCLLKLRPKGEPGTSGTPRAHGIHATPGAPGAPATPGTPGATGAPGASGTPDGKASAPHTGSGDPSTPVPPSEGA